MKKEEKIAIPRWFLEVVEDTLRIQNNINLELEKGTGETCQDRNVKQSLNGIRKLLKGEELTGMERLEKLQPELPSNLDEAAEEYAWKKEEPLSDGERLSFCFKPRIDAFKAGAEWMAGQGVGMVITDETEWAEVDKFVHSNCDGASVIQIRKK